MKTSTPLAERVRIVLVGLRNTGKSSLMNNLFENNIAIVSPHAGTTTDPVTRAYELIGAGPVAVTDTAGIDDVGDLGALRIGKTKEALNGADVVLVVTRGDMPLDLHEQKLVAGISESGKDGIVVLTHSDLGADITKKEIWPGHACVAVDNLSGKGIPQLKELLIERCNSVKQEITPVEGLVNEGDLVVLVTPIDLAAPKGRLILPQVETIRDLLDKDCSVLVVKERELRSAYENLKHRPKLVITDSQAFSKVAADIPADQPLTSFSILFARKKGDLAVFVKGVKALNSVKSGSRVMVFESCSHHRQADDIGTVKIPRLFRQMIDAKARFEFCRALPDGEKLKGVDLVIMCGGCMVNRNTALANINLLEREGIPVTNYGLFLAYVNGLLPRALEPFPGLWAG